MFSLRFDKLMIHQWAGRYPIDADENVETLLAPRVRTRRYYSKDELVEICSWKTPRSKLLVKSNEANFIREVTRTALITPDERLRVEVLTLLKGVGWPTASALLHFGHQDSYPILDFRALWSLGVDAVRVTYDFDFWWAYTQFCRQLAAECGVSMRVLDQALWQYSSECQ